MAPTLRVQPAVLRNVSADERSVAAAASNTEAPGALADAAAGMAGLRTADGCRSARETVASANRSVSTALEEHSDKLDAAARQYETTDAAFGHRLQQFSR